MIVTATLNFDDFVNTQNEDDPEVARLALVNARLTAGGADITKGSITSVRNLAIAQLEYTWTDGQP